MGKKFKALVGIFHSPVYIYSPKGCIIELSADVETGNSKLGNASTSLCFSQFQVSNFGILHSPVYTFPEKACIIELVTVHANVS